MDVTPAGERAARGAALLDRERPGWAAKVVPARLDLADCRRCVLGQLFQSFGPGLAALGLQSRAADHGFAADRDAWFDDLLPAWLAEINSRRTDGIPLSSPACPDAGPGEADAGNRARKRRDASGGLLDGLRRGDE